jgi:hypothetical protein
MDNNYGVSAYLILVCASLQHRNYLLKENLQTRKTPDWTVSMEVRGFHSVSTRKLLRYRFSVFQDFISIS